MTNPSHPIHPRPAAPAEPEILQPVAAALAFLLPGLGHAYLGEARRGLFIALGVFGLFFGGILVGGIDVVDRREDFVWFMGQAFVGPVAFGVDAVHQQRFKVHPRSGTPRSALPHEMRDPETGEPVAVRDPETGRPLEIVDPRTGARRPADADDGPPNIKSLGRVNELGTLMCTIAGMMNLICMIDAASYRPRRARGAGGPVRLAGSLEPTR